jgi:hypothetical protein
MKKFLIAGSSLATVSMAGFAGAVDVTLGGSIDMGVEFGLGKDNGNLMLGSAYNQISLSLSAAGTTDGGLRFGGSFTIGTEAEIEFKPYTSPDGAKYLAQKTNNDRTNILGHAYNVSGGGAVDVADIVSVKINSDWIGVNSDAIQNILPIETSFKSHNICKLAGRYGGGGGGFFPIHGSKLTDDPEIFDGQRTWALSIGSLPTFFASAQPGKYLPAGRAVYGIMGPRITAYSTKNSNNNGSNTSVTLKTTPTPWNNASQPYLTVKNGLGQNIRVKYKPVAAQAVTLRAVAGTGSSGVYAGYYPGVAKVSVGPFVTDDRGTADATDAVAYVGPFMALKMASSTTKMAVGAVCLTGVEESSTAFYMDNASKVTTVSGASIYIEGGFGKLSLQSSDYTGGVSAIAGAGDQADIEADGWVIAAEGYGLMGANPFIAMDLSKGDSLGDIEVITGGTFDLGGLSAAFDVALDNPTDLLGISSWDLGATYAMGDLALGFATDSSNDWGLSASMAVAGFGVNAVFGSSSAGDHQKSGITYSVSATTALNGYSLAIGFDQGLQPTIGVDYDLGGLNLYANYDAADEGGSVGATLSF